MAHKNLSCNFLRVKIIYFYSIIMSYVEMISIFIKFNIYHFFSKLIH